MSFKKLKPRWIFTAGVLLLLVSTATWWLRDPKAGAGAIDQPTPVPVTETVVADVEPTLEEPESGSETDPATTANFARQLTYVPNTYSPQDDETTTNVRDVTAENIEDLLQDNLDHALRGELASAYFVIRARRICERFANTPEDLERKIQRTNRKVERDIQRGRDLPSGKNNELPWYTTGDKESDRAHLQGWYDACQRVQSIFTTDLRHQLELLALQGDVMAAYLYASWPLDQLDTGEAFDQQFRWEGLARDFSQANMDRGEVAGLMAFAQSYMNGWFTARNGDLALAFSIAALNCGFETNSSRNFIGNKIDHLTTSEDPADQQRLQFALLEAERLALLCAH